MSPCDFLTDELKGVRSAPVPGFVGLRADEDGNLWQRREGAWVKLRAENRTSLKSTSGAQVTACCHKFVCMAWHGERPKNWCVRFKDGNPKNRRPGNLEWVEKRTGRPRKLSAWDQDEAQERAENGESLTDLAEEYGVSVASMSKWCKRAGTDGRSVAATRKRTEEERAAAVADRLKGKKLIVVQRRHKISQTHLLRIVKQHRARQEQPQCSSSAST